MMDLEPCADMLTPEDVAAMKRVTPCAVRLAIREGRLAASKVIIASRYRNRIGRRVWRIAPPDAVAWDAETRQPRDGAVVVDPGPKRDGELSIAEAVALKGVTETALRQAIYTHRLTARWAPHETRAAAAVPTRGNNNQGHWYIQRADLQAWHPSGRSAGGTGSRTDPVNVCDDMTVPEVAALKGVTVKSVRKAIYQGRLPAVWVPWEHAEGPRPLDGRSPGRWLIQRNDADAYARSPKVVPSPRRKAPPDAV